MSDEERKVRLSEILPQLNVNQLRYLSIRAECSSDAEAAELMGVPVGTVYNWPNKDMVKEALLLSLQDGLLIASEILRRNLPKAAAVKAGGLDSESERIRQDAATEILDRGLGKPTQRQEFDGSVSGEFVVRFARKESSGESSDAA